MSECDNWEHRRAMLEKIGARLHRDNVIGFYYEIGESSYMVEGLKSMSDSGFLDLIEKKSNNSTINHPSYYKNGSIEVIDYIEDKKLGFHLGNVVKYVSRAGKKGDALEDLKKAQWYLNREIERR